MKPAPFKYIAPSTLTEALDIMTQHGYDAKLLAGGQSLIPVMNFRLAQPAIIVDLNKVDELRQSRTTERGGLRIGPMIRHSQLEHSSTVAEYAPLVHETMPHIAHPQIRNRGTIGGSLAHADPAAELPAIMMTLQARFRLQKAAGERWVNAEDFYQALFTTALEPEEIIVEIAIPPMPRYAGHAFMEIARRHGDFAQVGAAALIKLDESGYCRQARLVFLNVGEIPMVAETAVAKMIGQIPSSELIDDIARHAAQNEIDPAGDIHSTADYKRHLAHILSKRAIRQAVTRAREAREL